MVSEGFVDAPRAQGQWALAWRRLKRDRLAVACRIFLLNLVADLVVLALDPTVAQRGRSTSRLLGRPA